MSASAKRRDVVIKSVARLIQDHAVLEKRCEDLEVEVEYLKQIAAGARDRAREELTKIIPKEDVVYPNGRPAHLFIKVPGRVDNIGFDTIDPWNHVVQDFTLRAEQHALVLPDGTRVVWYGWRWP